MRANAPLAMMLVLFALVAAPASLLAGTPAKQEKKKRVTGHTATQHAVSHPDEHPETHSKQRDAEAKQRLAKDRKQQKKDQKQQKKSEKAAKGRRAHSVSEPVTRRSRWKSAAPRGRVVTQDPATASRVHAWVNSQRKMQQSSTDPHIATSADFVKAANLDAGPSAQAGSKAGGKNDVTNDNASGTSTPPPDTADAEPKKSALSQPVSVVGVVRKSAEKAQLPPVEEVASEPVILPTLYTRRGRLVVPPPLKGSHEILLRQNQVADDEGLDRIQDDEALDRMRGAGLLISIPSNAMLHVDERLPVNRRYCRPWTALFIETLARQHYARFQSALQLTSAVRTVEFQQQLIHRNGNAAPAEGDTASPHLTGQAIDIGKKGLSVAEIAWLRGYLLPLVQQGKVDVEEEFQQSCFHISVYKKYLPRAAAGRRSIATTHSSGIDTLATGLR